MKKIIILSLMVILIYSCEKESTNNTITQNPTNNNVNYNQLILGEWKQYFAEEVYDYIYYFEPVTPTDICNTDTITNEFNSNNEPNYFDTTSINNIIQFRYDNTYITYQSIFVPSSNAWYEYPPQEGTYIIRNDSLITNYSIDGVEYQASSKIKIGFMIDPIYGNETNTEELIFERNYENVITETAYPEWDPQCIAITVNNSFNQEKFIKVQ